MAEKRTKLKKSMGPGSIWAVAVAQSVDQSGATTGIVNAHQVHFLKSEVSQNCKSTWHCVL